MNRRSFLLGSLASNLFGASDKLGFRFADITRIAGLDFRHHNGAFGSKYLPEMLGPGCAFLDYDNDGWQDILLVDGAPWPGRDVTKPASGSIRLYHNNRDGTFTDVSSRAGLDVSLYGMGVAVGDFNNDGFADFYVTTVGQNRLFQNTGRGKFIDVTRKSGLGGRHALSTSATWVDYNRDGLLDLFVCNYVKWSAKGDIFCSLDGKTKSYCTPETYHGATCWLFRNRGNGTFEDVTVKSGLFDDTSKSLGVATLDVDADGWPDLFVVNGTQPNKLYRNQRDGTFKEAAVRANVAFSSDGKARAGSGVDIADYDNSGVSSIVVTNFDHEMAALFKPNGHGAFQDVAPRTEIGRATKDSLSFGCCFLDIDLDGLQDLVIANGHIDDTIQDVSDIPYEQAPSLFLNQGGKVFKDVASAVGGGFANPKVGRGLAYADIDLDGDLDLLMTTNSGAVHLYRNDILTNHKSVRVRLVGTKSNRSAIGALVRVSFGGITSMLRVKSGSSYLSQSELPLTFGTGAHDFVDSLKIEWPSGRKEEFRKVKSGTSYIAIEGRGMKAGR